MRMILAALVASSLAVPMASAQTPSQEVAPVAASGQWRASKLIGVNVYNDQNEKLGEISELIVDRSGRVTGAILGVGGFLGMGEHDVMVPMDRLKFSNEANKSTTGQSGDGKQWYPDRAVVSATKDQLKAMPQFKY